MTLTPSDIEKALDSLKGWSFEDDALTRTVTFADFREAMAFMVRVGFEAEAQGHHPEWFNVYNRVEIALSTHDAGGKVTEKDLKLAEAINKLLT